MDVYRLNTECFPVLFGGVFLCFGLEEVSCRTATDAMGKLFQSCTRIWGIQAEYVG